MNDTDRLRRAFALALNIPEAAVTDALTYAKSTAWDSLAHMTLVAVLEETFEVRLQPDDVVNMSTYGKAREILTRRSAAFVRD